MLCVCVCVQSLHLFIFVQWLEICNSPRSECGLIIILGQSPPSSGVNFTLTLTITKCVQNFYLKVREKRSKLLWSGHSKLWMTSNYGVCVDLSDLDGEPLHPLPSNPSLIDGKFDNCCWLDGWLVGWPYHHHLKAITSHYITLVYACKPSSSLLSMYPWEDISWHTFSTQKTMNKSVINWNK